MLVSGNVNIHVHDAAARRLQELLTSFDMVQHLTEPTHRQGSKLDLVMTFADFQLDEVSVIPLVSLLITRYSLVRCRLTDVDPAPTTQRLVRAWRRADRNSPVSPDAAIDRRAVRYL